MDRGWFRWALAAGLVLSALPALTANAHPAAVDRPGARRVALGVDTTERAGSVSGGIAIHRSHAAALRHPTVAYSVRLRRLGSRRERVRIAGSLYQSYCVGSDIDGSGDHGSPCERRGGDRVPNPRYRLVLEARLYRAAHPGESGRGSVKPFNRPRRATCTLDVHHCPITVSAKRAISAPAAGRRYVNLEVLAWTHSRRWRPGDVLELEGDCRRDRYRRCRPLRANRPKPSDHAERMPTRGQLSVLRLGSAYGSPPDPGAATASSSAVDDPTLDVNGDPTVVHAAKLHDLVSGDVLEARGRVEITGEGFDHDAESWWVLSASPARTAPLANRPDRYASGDSGTNCLGPDSHLNTVADGRCSISQRGAVRVPRGARRTMYLNYVVEAKDRTTSSDPTATVTGGAFRIRCDSQPRPGSGCSVSP
ncbi:MAG TPA: hypothetical protein VKG89_04415 [Solirubrobacterales bacterium]|nr:hypothetical protein [Solirubrobacterales bacterium]